VQSTVTTVCCVGRVASASHTTYPLRGLTPSYVYVQECNQDQEATSHSSPVLDTTHLHQTPTSMVERAPRIFRNRHSLNNNPLLSSNSSRIKLATLHTSSQDDLCTPGMRQTGGLSAACTTTFIQYFHWAFLFNPPSLI
jgi:hypothetical protein